MRSGCLRTPDTGRPSRYSASPSSDEVLYGFVRLALVECHRKKPVASCRPIRHLVTGFFGVREMRLEPGRTDLDEDLDGPAVVEEVPPSVGGVNGDEYVRREEDACFPKVTAPRAKGRRKQRRLG